MTCPRCNSETYVIRNGQASGERRRKCLECSHEFLTVEVYAEQAPRHELKRHIAEILARSDNGGRHV